MSGAAEISTERKAPRERPPHIRSLTLKNFRGFKSTKALPLAPLTFLVGPNSSGKSSLLDAILLVAQSPWLPSPYFRTDLRPTWIGPLVDLGSYADTVYAHNTTLPIKIGLELLLDRNDREGYIFSNRAISYTFELKADSADVVGEVHRILIAEPPSQGAVRFVFHRDDAQEQSVRVTTPIGAFEASEPKTERPYSQSIYGEISKKLKTLASTNKMASNSASMPPEAVRRIAERIDTWLDSHWLSFIHRVSSGRGAPKRWYPRTGATPGRFPFNNDLRLLNEINPDSLLMGIHPGGHRRHRDRVTEKLAAALRELGVANAIASEDLSAYHSAIRVVDSITGIQSNLSDVGYGVAQVLPVLIAEGLAAKSPLIIEQPEVHLHPRAQGILADRLALASHKRQVLIETHSVHFINRARLLVAQGTLAPEDVMVLYVDRTRHGSTVKPIPILANGTFGEVWPYGFFDERYADTVRLLELKAKYEAEHETQQ